MNTLLAKGIQHLESTDKVLREIIKKQGTCDLSPSKNYFQNLVRAIIAQQLSSKASATIHERFSKILGNQITPENILKLKNEEFRGSGVSNQKMNYLIDLSKIYIKDKYVFSNLEKYSNEEIIAVLTKINGIGLWTAQMFLIFSLNRLNVLPLDDTGIRNSVKVHYKLKKHPDKKSLKKIASKWGEYSSIAVWYLWKALDNKNSG